MTSINGVGRGTGQAGEWDGRDSNAGVLRRKVTRAHWDARAEFSPDLPAEKHVQEPEPELDAAAYARARIVAVIAVIEALFDEVFEQAEDEWPQRVGATLAECKRMVPRPPFAEAWELAMSVYPAPKEWASANGMRVSGAAHHAAKAHEWFKERCAEAYEV